VALELLKAEDFYLPEHRAIWSAVIWLEERRETVDAEMVAYRLKDAGWWEKIGGSPELAQLLDVCSDVANTGAHARVVRDLGRVRRTLRKLRELEADGREGELGAPEDWLHRVDVEVQEATVDPADVDSGSDYSRAIADAYEQIGEAARADSPPGIWTGLSFVDELTRGMESGDKWILAGTPGQGKTALAQQIAEGVAEGGGGVVFFTLEMKRKKLARRALARRSGISANRIKSGRLAQDEWQKLALAVKAGEGLPIIIDDCRRAKMGGRRLTPGRLRARLRRWMTELTAKGVKLHLVVLDYAQLMSADRRTSRMTREEELAEISASGKDVAEELDCAYLELSQLNRAWGDAKDKRPNLKDLRGSGAFEQDADGVLFIHRDDGYERDKSKHDGTAEIICAKGRNVGTGRTACHFQPETTAFWLPEDERQVELYD
jgi:replicative DNA helicase